ncbi:MAG: hypothetical protein EA369_02680 [Bradymonadales bacterium]|nr:MAG: hypothetical protein EA369_02680 [Bradymonadales bacterium]
MTSPTGTKKSSPSFTFVEIIAVIALIAIVVGVSVQGFRSASGPLRRGSQNLIRDIQGAYHQALRQGEVFRMEFFPEDSLYQISKFELPSPPPSREDSEAFREWEDAERERMDRLRALGRDERRSVSAIDRASFILVEQRALPRQIQLAEFHRERENPLEADSAYILFYPTGELDSVLMIFEDLQGRKMSLFTEALTGRVRTFARALSLEEWAEKRIVGYRDEEN